MERKDHPTMGKARRRGRERGVVLAEFVLLLPALLLIIVGIVEFGHLWHLQHTVTNASREGARTAILYRGAYNQATVVTEATQVVDNYLAQFLPAGVWSTEVTAPATYTTGANVTVKVTTTEGLMLLDKLVPAAAEYFVVEAETIMKLE
jgi:Flp pilus assembly protein TadG